MDLGLFLNALFCSVHSFLSVALLQSETSPKPAFDIGRTFSEAKSGYYLYQKYVYPWEEKKMLESLGDKILDLSP